MKIISVCPNSFAANTYLLGADGKAIVIDPSVSVSAVERALVAENAQLCAILLTHGHFDHTVSVDTLRDKYDIPLLIHSGDAPMLTDGMINGFYDFYGRPSLHRPADRELEDGDEIPIGNETVKVLSTPGHSPGSICLLCPKDDGGSFLVTGDTLFANTIGRCDLWRGSEVTIRQSLIKLSALNGDMEIFPGHGPSNTLSSALELAKYYIDL